jgi:hypothetical protein
MDGGWLLVREWGIRDGRILQGGGAFLAREHSGVSLISIFLAKKGSIAKQGHMDKIDFQLSMAFAWVISVVLLL